jgi:hypothetical protein
MSAETSQSFENHSRYVPGYHLVLSGLLIVNFVYAVYQLVVDASTANVIALLTAVALIILGYYAREFALRDQDRIIRLEERLRLTELLPPEMRTSIQSLTTRQLIALRFASDGEVADLVRKVLDEKISDPKEIKRLIKTWRPDHHRI